MSAGADRPIEGQRGARTPAAPENSGDAAAAAAAPGLQLDLLGQVAESSNAVRRGAGRPPGATNRRNDETFDYLEALGFKAPERFLMEVVAADTKELSRKLGADAIEVLKLQVKAAGELMPYKLARKPQAHEIRKATLHLFMAGNLTPEQEAQIKENQLLSLDDLVGETDNSSHETGNAEAHQRDE